MGLFVKDSHHTAMQPNNCVVWNSGPQSRAPEPAAPAPLGAPQKCSFPAPPLSYWIRNFRSENPTTLRVKTRPQSSSKNVSWKYLIYLFKNIYWVPTQCQALNGVAVGHSVTTRTQAQQSSAQLLLNSSSCYFQPLFFSLLPIPYAPRGFSKNSSNEGIVCYLKQGGPQFWEKVTRIHSVRSREPVGYSGPLLIPNTRSGSTGGSWVGLLRILPTKWQCKKRPNL